MAPDLVDPLLDQVLEWAESGVPVEAIAIRIRRHLPDQPSQVRLVKALRRRARALWADSRWAPAQRLERIVEAMERSPGA